MRPAISMLWVAMIAARPEARTSWVRRLEHVVGRARVEIAGRLVGQQDARRIGDRARDRDALLLAAGQLRRAVRQALLQAEIGQAARPRGWIASLRRRPRIICGSITFSSAENSGSRWWDW